MKNLTAGILVVFMLFVSPAFALAQAADQSQGNASLNWAGYVAQGANYTAVSGAWIIPAVTLSSGDGDADATWVGIGGVESSDLIQAGTQAVIQDGSVTYEAWIETLPHSARTVPLSVKSGDMVDVSLAEEMGGEWLVTITDISTGQQYQTTIQYQSSHSSAEWVEEMVSNAAGSFYPLDSFGTVSFSDDRATANGESGTIAQLGAQPLQMINGAGQTLAGTSALGAGGASFIVSRTSASASVAATGYGRRWRIIPTATSTGAPATQNTQNTITVVGRRRYESLRAIQIPGMRFVIVLPQGF